MIAAACLPLRSDPANNQFERRERRAVSVSQVGVVDGHTPIVQ